MWRNGEELVPSRFVFSMARNLRFQPRNFSFKDVNFLLEHHQRCCVRGQLRLQPIDLQRGRVSVYLGLRRVERRPEYIVQPHERGATGISKKWEQD